MTYTEQAIQKAVEGGYYEKHFNFFYGNNIFYLDHVFLDPLFWQALGKGLGWEWCKTCLTVGEYIKSCPHCGGERQWKREWHCFVDHLDDRKDTESFFKGLLSKKNGD